MEVLKEIVEVTAGRADRSAALPPLAQPLIVTIFLHFPSGQTFIIFMDSSLASLPVICDLAGITSVSLGNLLLHSLSPHTRCQT